MIQDPDDPQFQATIEVALLLIIMLRHIYDGPKSDTPFEVDQATFLDALALAQHFAQTAAEENGADFAPLTAEALEARMKTVPRTVVSRGTNPPTEGPPFVAKCLRQPGGGWICYN